MTEEIRKWLTGQCNVYLNGACHTLFCRRKGEILGRNHPTCEPLECLEALECMEMEIDCLRKKLESNEVKHNEDQNEEETAKETKRSS